MDGLSIKTLQELGQDSHQNISVAGYKGAWVGSQVSGFFFFGGTGSLFQKDIYQFSVSKQLHYWFFFLPVGPQRDHTEGENILSQLRCRMHT